MPSTTTFDRQSVAYKTSVLPAGVPRIAVEAGVTDGWWKYGCAAVVGIDTYGESAPAPELFKHFSFTRRERGRHGAPGARALRLAGRRIAAAVRGSRVLSSSTQGESPMTIKIGINGFGRIGRMVFRAAVQNFPGHRGRRASTTCSSPTTWPTC